MTNIVSFTVVRSKCVKFNAGIQTPDYENMIADFGSLDTLGNKFSQLN